MKSRLKWFLSWENPLWYMITALCFLFVGCEMIYLVAKYTIPDKRYWLAAIAIIYSISMFCGYWIYFTTGLRKCFGLPTDDK